MLGTFLPENIEWGLRGVQDVLNIHPLFVPFPFALLLSSFAFYGLGSLFRSDGLLAAGKWSLYFGTLAALATVWAGLEAEKTVPHGEDVHDLMITHKYFGFAVASLSVILSAWVYWSKSNIPRNVRLPFLSLLLLLCLILIQGADFGGRMVFFHGVGMGRKSFMKEAPPEHKHAHAAHSHETAEEAPHEHDEHEHEEHAH